MVATLPTCSLCQPPGNEYLTRVIGNKGNLKISIKLPKKQPGEAEIFAVSTDNGQVIWRVSITKNMKAHKGLAGSSLQNDVLRLCFGDDFCSDYDTNTGKIIQERPFSGEAKKFKPPDLRFDKQAWKLTGPNGNDSGRWEVDLLDFFPRTDPRDVSLFLTHGQPARLRYRHELLLEIDTSTGEVKHCALLHSELHGFSRAYPVGIHGGTVKLGAPRQPMSLVLVCKSPPRKVAPTNVTAAVQPLMTLSKTPSDLAHRIVLSDGSGKIRQLPADNPFHAVAVRLSLKELKKIGPAVALLALVPTEDAEGAMNELQTDKKILTSAQGHRCTRRWTLSTIKVNGRPYPVTIVYYDDSEGSDAVRYLSQRVSTLCNVFKFGKPHPGSDPTLRSKLDQISQSLDKIVQNASSCLADERQARYGKAGPSHSADWMRFQKELLALEEAIRDANGLDPFQTEQWDRFFDSAFTRSAVETGLMDHAETALLPTALKELGRVKQIHVVINKGDGTVRPAEGYGWANPGDVSKGAVVWMPGTPKSGKPHVIAAPQAGIWMPEPGYDWSDRGNFAVGWVPGMAHSTKAHVHAATEEGKWALDPGYIWDDQSNAQWQKGLGHGPPYEHVYATAKEGEWQVEDGFTWVNDAAGDLRVKPAGQAAATMTRLSVPRILVPIPMDPRDVYKEVKKHVPVPLPHEAILPRTLSQALDPRVQGQRMLNEGGHHLGELSRAASKLVGFAKTLRSEAVLTPQDAINKVRQIQKDLQNPGDEKGFAAHFLDLQARRAGNIPVLLPGLPTRPERKTWGPVLSQEPPMKFKKIGQFPGAPVYYVNGMQTASDKAFDEAEALAKRVQRPVLLVYCPSISLEQDLQDAIYDRSWAYQFQTGLRFQGNTTTKYLTYVLLHLAEGEKISIVSHSRGCLITRNALLAADWLGAEDLAARVAWVETGTPLPDNEIGVKPNRFQAFANDGDLIASELGLKTEMKLPGNWGEALDKHDFQKSYVKQIPGNSLWP
jgi:hypothetical protein